MSFLHEIPKAIFDRLIPRYRDGVSSSNLRNQFLALAEGDILPLRPTTEITVESMDYGKESGAQAEWSGTGVTVEIDKVDQNDGIACLKLTIDVTGNRECKRAVLSPAVDLSNFAKLGVWNRCDKASSAIQFLIRDSSGNESYWDITTNATPDTFEQAALDLSTPDSNNGTDADLSDVTQYGYKGLDASSVYLFDSIFAYVWAMKIYITQSVQGSYFLQVYAGIDRVSFSGGFSPTMTAPTTDPRIDLVSITKSGTVEVATGTEEVSPGDSDIPACPFGNIPICAIYQKPSATKIVDYHQKDVYTSDSYIYKDLRPFMGMTGSGLIYKGESAPPSMSAGMLWIYTPAAGNYFLKMRNKDNDAWIDIIEFDDSGLLKIASGGMDTFSRSNFSYKDADQIYLGAAMYMCKDKFCSWISTLTSPVTGAGGGADWWYLYLDYSAITSGTPITATELIWSTAEPTWNNTYRQWMNGDDRCIFAVRTDASSNILEFSHCGEVVFFADRIISMDGLDPDTTWTDVTAIIPIFTRRALATFRIKYIDVETGAYWRTNGQTGTVGHFLCWLRANAVEGNAQLQILTDSAGIFEARFADAGGSLFYIWTDGWIFPTGM